MSHTGSIKTGKTFIDPSITLTDHSMDVNGILADQWQFDISESEISADVNAIRRILVIVSGILADANGISAEYQ